MIKSKPASQPPPGRRQPARGRPAAAAVLAAAALAAGCSSQGPSGTSSRGDVVRVTCADSGRDAAVLQRAVNASPAGASIDIGGTCLLTRPITLLANRTYTGDSRTGTVLRQGARLPYVLASAAFTGNSAGTGLPLTLTQLTVQCSGQGKTDGVVILNWQAEVDNIDVHNCGGSGIVDTSQTADGRMIRNTSVNSRFENNFITGSGESGFEVADRGNAVTDGYFVDNQVADSRGTAVSLRNAAGWTITGNHLYGDNSSGIIADRLYGTTIGDNYIEDFASRRIAGYWYGIAGSAQGGPGSTIDGNKIFSSLGVRGRATHVYIAIIGVNYGSASVAVTGNVIKKAGAGDIALSFSGGRNHLTATSAGNEVTGPGRVTVRGSGVSLSRGT